MQKYLAPFFALTLLLIGSACFRDRPELPGNLGSKRDKMQVIHPTGDAMAPLKEFNLKAGDKLLATFKTSMGDMTAELYWDKAPQTVANFVGLAMGTKEWTRPGSKEPQHQPLYSGTTFHRVIPGFMIQGGDPMGNGMGGPGYQFSDEFNPQLRHDSAGILSMANAGPNTNGSQFFITEVPTPFLNNRHAVFGKVIDNVALVTTIANVPRDGRDKPTTPVTLNEVVIHKKS